MLLNLILFDFDSIKFVCICFDFVLIYNWNLFDFIESVSIDLVSVWVLILN